MKPSKCTQILETQNLKKFIKKDILESETCVKIEKEPENPKYTCRSHVQMRGVMKTKILI
jgi:hypothetical protein